MDSPILCVDCGFPLTKEEALAACFGGLPAACTECRAARLVREMMQPAPHPMCRSTVTAVPPKAKPKKHKPKPTPVEQLEALVSQLQQADADLDYEIATGKPATKKPRRVTPRRKMLPLSTATWKQKGGQIIKLSQMTASHLWFSIRMLERRLRQYGGGFDPLLHERLSLAYRERERRLRSLEPRPLAACPDRLKKATFYLLREDEDGVKHPVEVPGPAWQDWFETRPKERHVAFTPVAAGVEVLTVYLGIDHNFSGQGPHLLYETMVFGGVRDGSQWRCSTEAEARAKHEETVNEVREAEKAAKVEAAAQEAARAELVARQAAQKDAVEALRAAMEAAEAEAEAAKLRVEPKTDRFIKLGD